MIMTDVGNSLETPLFQALADLNFDSVMVTEATNDQGNSKIVFVNQRFTDLTGYAADEVIGKTPGLLQGPGTEKTVTDRLVEEVSNGQTFHGSTINYRKDGSSFHIEWKVTPVKQNGRVTHYLAVQRELGID